MKLSKSFLIAFLILLIAGFANAGTIKGTVTDSTSSELLRGANVVIEGTSLGAATDLEGRYVIPRVPPGQYTLKVMYIGYKEAKYTVRLTRPNETVTQNAALVLSVLEGQEVTISAQAQGQLAAINQQLAADAMMNIVDRARIQEVPDQNAAEAIRRLPGVTITRNAGEGSGIGIRGLAPEYNQVQIDGVIMNAAPEMQRAESYVWSTGRGVSLSNISQENLATIELIKAITPDMDAATFGGTVNMRLGKAPQETEYLVKSYGAYNEARDNWKQYKIYGRASQRLFNNKFGLQLSVNAEQRDRGVDRLSGDIQPEDFTTIIGTDTVKALQFRTGPNTRINNNRAIRKKQGISAIFDYDTPGTELLFSNFFTFGQLTSMQISRANTNIQGSKSMSESYNISNALRGTHDISKFKVEWQLSHSKSETKTPEDYEHGWSMQDRSKAAVDSLQSVHWELPENTPEKYLELLPDDGWWQFFRTYERIAGVNQTQYAEKLDITYPFYFKKMSGFFKMGGKFSQIERESFLRERDLHNGRFPGVSPVWADYPTDYDPDPVLNGRVTIRHFFDVDKIKSVWDNELKDYGLAKYQELKYKNPNNYSVQENYNAGYLMMKLNAFNDVLTFISGVRYESEKTDGKDRFLYLKNENQVDYNGLAEDREATHSEDFWLPMVHLKVKPVSWFDTRLAVTKTINRPNYRYRLPYIIGSYEPGATVRRGVPDLKTASSWNYDLSTSFYDSKFGLFTIAGFYKEIRNFAFEITHYVETVDDAIKYALDLTDPIATGDNNDYLNRPLQTPENTHGISTVKGVEIDYQANLRWLPGLLKNLTFNINYTRAWSKSWLRTYEIEVIDSYFDLDTYEFVEIKEYHTDYRRGPMIRQPDHILNTAIGYDIGGFTGRFSLFYQSKSLSGIGDTAPRDSYVQPFWQYDVSLRYRFNEHLSFLATGTNLTSTADISRLNGTNKNSIYEVYGTMYDFGLELTF